MDFLNELNPAQREAVTATEGPVLVLAGAGSGKTRVITYRLAHLVAQGGEPGSILAVTFTNKAADEMRERAAALLRRTGGDAGAIWLATFHSFCARLLRREAKAAGLRRDFPIYDADDQAAAVKQAVKNLKLPDRAWTPRELAARISNAKIRGEQPEDLAAAAQREAETEVASVYAEYQRILAQAGALDFDDLLVRAVELLEDKADVRERWRRRFGYLHVDEYQDTNRPQYELLRLLAGEQANLCVVGDEDQAIYGWRGADVENILRFHEDFPGARVIRLEENYRSTQPILDAASGVVANNRRRLGKTLRATRGAGPPVEYFEAADAQGEAEYVTGEIARKLRESADARLAVLYRTNAQSRPFEDALRRQSVSYIVLGGMSFYQRAEVKDTLAWVRLAVNPGDDIALARVINVPPRGIGQTTLERLRERAAAANTSLWEALESLIAEAGGKRLAALEDFRELLTGLREAYGKEPPAEFLRRVLRRTGYLDWLMQQETPEAEARAENLGELVNAVAELGEGAEGDAGESFQEFLDRTALVSDADGYDAQARVVLMTLHTAKGLEVDEVFLCGLEEGLFPHARSLDSGDVEEERRLCYVGMTRARDRLVLTSAQSRRSYGEDRFAASVPSRFLSEIPAGLLATVAGSMADAGETRRYEPDPEYAALRGRASGRRRGAGGGLVGVRVRHPSYGLGTILSIEGEGEDRKITVSFQDYGTKKLLERYAHLERA
jgi:DNA helicase-2/ATP-dependent DNA helicase PcrA